MNTIKNLSKICELHVEGTDNVVRIDFSDKRLVGNILRLMKKYQNIDESLNKEFESVEIEDALEKLIAYAEIEEKILTTFKEDVDKAFNTNITEQMFGDTLPGVERYAELFNTILPYLSDYKKEENAAIEELNKLYNTDKFTVVDGGEVDV